MGVKGLLKLGEQAGEPVAWPVAWPSRRSAWSLGSLPTERVLFVDGYGTLRKLYSTQLDWLRGGQWMQLRQNVSDFVEAFERAGIRTVWVFDGCVEPLKQSTWISRRRDDNRRCVKALERAASAVETGTPLTRDEVRKLIVMPIGVGSWIVVCLRALGVEVHFSVGEGDEELAARWTRAAAAHEQSGDGPAPLGVLGEDSDFHVLGVPWYSLKELRMPRMFDGKSIKTVRYGAGCVAERLLGLPQRAMPLLACLCGCDFVNVRRLEWFHRRLLAEDDMETAAAPTQEAEAGAPPPRPPKIPSDVVLRTVARFVAKHDAAGKSVEEIVQLALPPRAVGALTAAMRGASLSEEASSSLAAAAPPASAAPSALARDVLDALALYRKGHGTPASVRAAALEKWEGTPRERDALLRLLEKHQQGEISKSLIPLVLFRESFISPTMEIAHCGYSVFADVRAREYGILARHYGEAGFAVKEITIHCRDMEGEPRFVHAVPVPSSVEVAADPVQWWSRCSSRKQRLSALYYCFFGVGVDSIPTVAMHHVPMAVVLTFLALRSGAARTPAAGGGDTDAASSSALLSVAEFDALLAQAVSRVPHFKEPHRNAVCRLVAPRLIEVGALFNLGLDYVATTNSVCGCPLTAKQTGPWNCYNGMRFQNKMEALAAADGREQGGWAALLACCDDDEETARTFASYKGAILKLVERISGAPLWRGKGLQAWIGNGGGGYRGGRGGHRGGRGGARGGRRRGGRGGVRGGRRGWGTEVGRRGRGRDGGQS